MHQKFPEINSHYVRSTFQLFIVVYASFASRSLGLYSENLLHKTFTISNVRMISTGNGPSADRVTLGGNCHGSVREVMAFFVYNSGISHESRVSFKANASKSSSSCTLPACIIIVQPRGSDPRKRQTSTLVRLPLYWRSFPYGRLSFLPIRHVRATVPRFVDAFTPVGRRWPSFSGFSNTLILLYALVFGQRRTTKTVANIIDCKSLIFLEVIRSLKMCVFRSHGRVKVLGR